MIALEFSLAQAQLLKAGTLTQQRVVCRSSEILKTKDTPLDERFGPIPARAELWRDATHRECFEDKWLYAAVAGNPLGKIKVKTLRQDDLQSLDAADSLSCGFARVLDFKLAWDSTHRLKNQKWAANPKVWVFSFVYYTQVFAG